MPARHFSRLSRSLNDVRVFRRQEIKGDSVESEGLLPHRVVSRTFNHLQDGAERSRDPPPIGKGQEPVVFTPNEERGRRDAIQIWAEVSHPHLPARSAERQRPCSHRVRDQNRQEPEREPTSGSGGGGDEAEVAAFIGQQRSIDQYESIDSGGPASRKIGGDPTSHRMTDDIRFVQPNCVHPAQKVDRGIVQDELPPAAVVAE